MKTLLTLIVATATACSSGVAGDSVLTQTFQPFVEAGHVRIVPVTCYDPKALSGLPTAIELITAKNIPPTNASEPIGDFNLASAAGIKLHYSEDRSSHGTLTIDFTQLHVTDSMVCTEEQIVRGTLECLRRAAGKRLSRITLTPSLKPTGQEEIRKIMTEFASHPMGKEFPLK